MENTIEQIKSLVNTLNLQNSSDRKFNETHYDLNEYNSLEKKIKNIII